MNHIGPDQNGSEPVIELTGFMSRSRDLLLGIGGVAVTITATAAREALITSREAMDFVRNAPKHESYAEDPSATMPIGYGDLRAAAEAGYPQYSVIFGDSIPYGYVADGEQHCTANVVVHDTAMAMEAAGVPEPKGENLDDHGYWIADMLARPGATTEDVQRQIETFRAVAEEVGDYDGPFSFELGMGGNDALAFLRAHLNPRDISFLFSDFRDEFLPRFREQCLSVIQSLVELQGMASLRGLERVIIMGIPDIGQAQSLRVMRLPGMGAIATAACSYMNVAILEVIREVQRTTQVQIYFEDTFGVPMGDIHPTRAGYRQLAERRERRCFGKFPDGTRSFWEECERHAIPVHDPQGLGSEPVELLVA